MSLEEAKAALDKFLNPDPYSRSTEHEGRRIRVTDGGWVILNYPKYRTKFSTEDRREYKRVKQAEYRARKAAGGMTMADRVRQNGSAEDAARMDEHEAELPPGALGSYGPEAQEAVQRRLAAASAAASAENSEPSEAEEDPEEFPEV